MPKKRTQVKFKPIKAWALVDPETGYVNSRYISETRERNAGRGSITEGWKCIRVLITHVTK